MSFFKPEDFKEMLINATFPIVQMEKAAQIANAKLEDRIKEIANEDGTQFLTRLIINENFKKHKRDEALEEAKELIYKFYNEQSNALQSIAFDSRPNRENMLRAKEWLKKYGDAK